MFVGEYMLVHWMFLAQKGLGIWQGWLMTLVAWLRMHHLHLSYLPPPYKSELYHPEVCLVLVFYHWLLNWATPSTSWATHCGSCPGPLPNLSVFRVWLDCSVKPSHGGWYAVVFSIPIPIITHTHPSWDVARGWCHSLWAKPLNLMLLLKVDVVEYSFTHSKEFYLHHQLRADRAALINLCNTEFVQSSWFPFLC